MIYVVIIEDRHSDTDVELFTDRDKAIDYAEDIAMKYSGGGHIDKGLTPPMTQAGWIYYTSYSCEGDSVRVVPKELK